jgi:hypothetical protein
LLETSAQSNRGHGSASQNRGDRESKWASRSDGNQSAVTRHRRRSEEEVFSIALSVVLQEHYGIRKLSLLSHRNIAPKTWLNGFVTGDQKLTSHEVLQSKPVDESHACCQFEFPEAMQLEIASPLAIKIPKRCFTNRDFSQPPSFQTKSDLNGKVK